MPQQVENYETEFLPNQSMIDQILRNDAVGDAYGPNKRRRTTSAGGSKHPIPTTYSVRDSICGKKIWTPEDDARLLELIELHGRQESSWEAIAAGLPGRTVRSCRARWFRAVLPSLDEAAKRNRPGMWTKEEDDLLEQLIIRYGRNWKKISGELGNRTPDACDIRWYSVICKRKKMDGDISAAILPSQIPKLENRRKWSPEEEALLCQLVDTYGSSERAWPIIANSLERSCTSCKGHFYAVISKKPPSDMGGELMGEGDRAAVLNAHAAFASEATDLRRRWSESDEKQLKALVDNKTSWAVIGATFGRTEEACKKHYSKVFPASSTSSSSVDAAPLGVAMLGGGDDITTAAYDISGATQSATTTPSKWNVKTLKRWTDEEDEQLRQLVETYGRKNWAVISSKLVNRSSDACECRWRDKLYPKLLNLEKELRDQIAGGQVDPTAAALAPAAPLVEAANKAVPNVFNTVDAMMPVQSRYTAAEDELLRGLIDTYGSSGNASWEKIASMMNGRSVHSCRMRWKQALRHTVDNSLNNANNIMGANNSSLPGNHLLLSGNNSLTLNGFDNVK